MTRLLFLLLLLFVSPSAHALTEAEIQHHIDTAIKAGGGEVVIPPGVHLIEHGLRLKTAKKLRLIGLDAEETVLKAGKAAVSLLRLDGGEDVRIEKLTCEGGQDGIVEWHDPREEANGLAKVRISRCFFQNQQRSAVLLPKAAAESVEIEGCTFRDIGESGVVFGEKAVNGSITHSHFTRCRVGVALHGSQQCLVGSNELNHCGTGILITGAVDKNSVDQGNVIALNAIAGSLENAIQFNSRTLKNSVLHNEISRSGGNGIRLDGEGQIVKGNQISGSQSQDLFTVAGKHEVHE